MNAEYTSNRLPVNWENGMMVTQNHLTEMNHYISSVYRNSLLNNTNPYNYGLLPAYDLKFNSLKINTEKQGENLFVRIDQCYVLTFDGMCFYINPETIASGAFPANDMSVNIDLLGATYNYILLYLVYKPEEFKKVGAVDISKDDFERKPNLSVDVKLSFTFIESLNSISERYDKSANAIPLAVVNVVNKENPILEKKYIPPCINFFSDERLNNIYDKIKVDAVSLLENASQVMNFVHEDSKGKLTSEIVMDMELLLKNMMPIIAEINAALKTDYKARPPVELIFLFKKLAITFRSNVDSLEYRRKREVTDYFAAQYGTPNDLAKIGIELTEGSYSHANMFSTALLPMKKFLDIMLNLMKEIASKGLKTQVFVAENEWEEDVKEQKQMQQAAAEKKARMEQPMTQPKQNEFTKDDDLWGNMIGD